MPVDVPVRCACGGLVGVAKGIDGDRGNRVVCYCDDCQSFAHFLGAPDRILDEHGGTDILQMSPARLEIVTGLDRIACMRLTARGVLRWYAGCCRTPIGNTLARRSVPLIGVIHSCLDAASLGREPDEVLGDVRARIYARFARGDRSRLNAHERVPLGQILEISWMILRARVRRDHLRSPLFDSLTGAPIASPVVLAPEELERLQAAQEG